MEKFLNVLASGARSFSFVPSMCASDFDDEPLINSGTSNFEPRKPVDFVRDAWDNAGKHLLSAMNEIEKEYGKCNCS
jgi:hypothetical protein